MNPDRLIHIHNTYLITYTYYTNTYTHDTQKDAFSILEMLFQYWIHAFSKLNSA